MGGAMGESDKTPRRSIKKARCAIYTRKSSEEGLEQAFNSLDAQREACAAFILSQKHEGSTVLPTLYDDGGFSGGTMERPALKRLIADIAAGQIAGFVVYKVDRLTRALSDFAKLVDVFDRRGVSFVSITQHFNTTTSMGRLTLNVLLSFAQFEREVTGERIRDKIAEQFGLPEFQDPRDRRRQDDVCVRVDPVASIEQNHRVFLGPRILVHHALDVEVGLEFLARGRCQLNDIVQERAARTWVEHQEQDALLRIGNKPPALFEIERLMHRREPERRVLVARRSTRRCV